VPDQPAGGKLIGGGDVDPAQAALLDFYARFLHPKEQRREFAEERLVTDEHDAFTLAVLAQELADLLHGSLGKEAVREGDAAAASQRARGELRRLQGPRHWTGEDDVDFPGEGAEPLERALEP
jgi:hypothetical protein